MDQFRGYTVAGMFLVNGIGHYRAIPGILGHHNTYCSYADVIMPQFFFAVGFALRLALLRHIEKSGKPEAYKKAVWRCLALMLIGFVVYGLNGSYQRWDELKDLGLWGFLTTSFHRSYFQALVHIGVTSLWILPVIAAGIPARIVFMTLSAALQLSLCAWFYFDWGFAVRVVDGGPIGFLTWCIPALFGSIAYDVVTGQTPPRAIRTVAVWSGTLMVIGYALSCLAAIKQPGTGLGQFLVEPPFIDTWRDINLWTMSQRVASVSYLVFAAGFSGISYVFFIWWSDIKGYSSELFRVFGQNALVGYIIHLYVEESVNNFIPHDAPLWWVIFGFSIFFGITWLLMRGLDRQGIHLRL